MSFAPLGPDEPTALPRRVVVSDAGPLICLGRLDLLALLGQQFARVEVPTQVLAECGRRPYNDDMARIARALADGWLTACEVEPATAGDLGLGERAAIARALATGAMLLTDDQGARLRAATLRIVTVGTLGVLVSAKRAGAVSAVAPLIERLRASGQRFGADVVTHVLNAAGEAAK